ncbi:nucleotide exchange factor GrpE [Chloroflexota bacterium]
MFGFGDNGRRDERRYFDPSWLGRSTDRDEEDEELEAGLKPAVVEENPVIGEDVVDGSGSLAQRIKADFANYKRRVEQEREKQSKCANKELILKLLPVLDDFNYALDSVPQNVADEDWLAGVTFIKDKLMSILEKEGVSKIDVRDKEFDPHQHEAIFCDDDAGDELCRVKEVIKDGYKLGDEVIRPAQVIVSN